jgi:hypothetical protein
MSQNSRGATVLGASLIKKYNTCFVQTQDYDYMVMSKYVTARVSWLQNVSIKSQVSNDQPVHLTVRFSCNKIDESKVKKLTDGNFDWSLRTESYNKRFDFFFQFFTDALRQPFQL